jgi:hypothetical protein
MRGAGTQFDPVVVQVVLEELDQPHQQATLSRAADEVQRTYAHDLADRLLGVLATA